MNYFHVEIFMRKFSCANFQLGITFMDYFHVEIFSLVLIYPASQRTQLGLTKAYYIRIRGWYAVPSRGIPTPCYRCAFNRNQYQADYTRAAIWD